MKYELGQVIYYMLNGKPHSAAVLSRMRVENLHDNFVSTDAQKSTFTKFGHTGVMYATCHGVIDEENAFASRDELKEAVFSEEDEVEDVSKIQDVTWIEKGDEIGLFPRVTQRAGGSCMYVVKELNSHRLGFKDSRVSHKSKISEGLYNAFVAERKKNEDKWEQITKNS